MGLFSKLFKGQEIDMEKSRQNAGKMRALFDQVVENSSSYQIIINQYSLGFSGFFCSRMR